MISLSNQVRNAESISGDQSVRGRARSPNPAQSTVLTRNSGANRSKSGYISARVEIELRAGRKTTDDPLPASSMPTVVMVFFHLEAIVRMLTPMRRADLKRWTQRDLWIDQFAEVGLEPLVCAFLILTHQPRVARHIGGQYRRQPALDPISAHSGRPARRRPVTKSS